jgi:hypothetical protein
MSDHFEFDDEPAPIRRDYNHTHRVRGSFGTGFGGAFGSCLGTAAAAVLLIGGAIWAGIYFIGGAHKAAEQRLNPVDVSATRESEQGNLPVDAGKKMRFGDVSIEFVDVSIKTPRVISGSGTEYDWDEPCLIVRLRVTNNSETRKFFFGGFKRDNIFQRDVAVVSDEFGNEYTCKIPLSDIVGTEHKDLYPGKSAIEILAFAPPVDRAQTFLLSLPASRVVDDSKQIGQFRFTRANIGGPVKRSSKESGK